MLVIRMHAHYDANITVEAEGQRGCRIDVSHNGQVLELAMTDEQLRQLVRAANRHLDERAAQRTLQMLEAERERRRRGERPEALAVMAETQKSEAAAEATATAHVVG